MMKLLPRTLIVTAAVMMALGGAASAQSGSTSAPENYTPTVGQFGKDVVWVPTSQALVDRMLDMVELTPQDQLVDLGSGDGVTVITAARRGAKARGIEFNPDMVALAKRKAREAGVSDRATFEQADIFQSDFSEATVVTLFLLPSLNEKLRPTLLDMAPGTRIVANSFDMGDWEPDETSQVTEGCTSYCRALKWVVPAKVEGSWAMDGKSLELRQRYQRLEGELRDGASSQAISDARLDGAQIYFSVGGDQYTGEVAGRTMQGKINGSGAWKATRAAGS